MASFTDLDGNAFILHRSYERGVVMPGRARYDFINVPTPRREALVGVVPRGARAAARPEQLASELRVRARSRLTFWEPEREGFEFKLKTSVGSPYASRTWRRRRPSSRARAPSCVGSRLDTGVCKMAVLPRPGRQRRDPAPDATRRDTSDAGRAVDFVSRAGQGHRGVHALLRRGARPAARPDPARGLGRVPGRQRDARRAGRRRRTTRSSCPTGAGSVALGVPDVPAARPRSRLRASRSYECGTPAPATGARFQRSRTATRSCSTAGMPRA